MLTPLWTDNPVGRCYNRSALIEYGKFAEKYDLHLVFDEVSCRMAPYKRLQLMHIATTLQIYALSTFASLEEEQPKQPFISALNIDWPVEAGCHPARVHILSSFSKDVCNGFRVGTLVSQFNA